MGGWSQASTGAQRARSRLVGIVASLALVLGLVPASVAFAEPPPDSPSRQAPPGQADLLASPAPLAQEISFSLPARGTGGESLTLDATASSGLPVGYRAQPRHRCALETAAEGTLLRFEAEGTCSVTASQPGDETWAPAPDVEATVEIAAPVVEVPPVEPPGQAKSRAEG